MARKSAQKKKGPDNKQSPEPEATNGHGEASEAKPFPAKKQPKKEANGIDSAEETVPRFDKARVRSRNQRQSKSCLTTIGVQIRNVLEKIEVPDNAFTRRLKGCVFSGQKAANAWAERNRPLIDVIKAKSEAAWARGRSGFDVVYPIVLRWLMSIGTVAFLVSVIWLDSFVRGLDSFFRMGTAAFFSVIWCAVFSTIAMAGIFKFFAVLAIAALVGLFAGFSLGILILGFFGALFLWLYGSFWTTTLVMLLGGLAYGLGHERVALLFTTVYSVYCGWAYVGWLGLVVAFNLTFVSSDVLIYFLKNSVNQQRRPASDSESTVEQEQTGRAFPPESGPGFSADRGPGMPSTSGAADPELTSDDEIIRLLNCGDHYSALGLARFETVDVSLLKREYKKKAMLVHPDKNMGNEKAVEAFKKLQNAYEVLLDSAKQKAYDDELRKEELLNIFHRFQNTSQMKGRPGFFASGMAPSEGSGDEAVGESRRIACKKCNSFHVWVLTRKTKSRARWCQECKEFHQAKDGDGWVEQSSQPLLFGLLQKVDSPAAFVCADSKIYDASEWYICQGMRCAPNTHKPSFHVNTSVASSKGSCSGQRGGRVPPNVEDCVTEEDFFEWLQSAVQSGAFDNMNMNPDPPSPAKPGSANAKRKKKGKKPW